MPRRSTAKDAPADFDDLINEVDETATAEEEDVDQASVPEEAPAAEKLTPAQQRLIAAREAAAALDAAPAPVENEDPFDGLNEEQIAELKALEDKVVQANTRKIVTAEPTFDNSRVGGTGEFVLFHVLIDGFNAFGNIWHRGQNLKVEVGTAAYKSTFNNKGVSWLTLIDDEHAQYEKWGQRRLGPGEFRPLPGEKFNDSLVAEDAQRGYRIPTIASV